MVSRYGLRRSLVVVMPYAWLLFFAGYILITEPPAYALFMLAATALHETGHLFAFLLCREPLPHFGGRAGGLILTPVGEMLSPCKELLICAAGPAFNLAACAALLPALRAGIAPGASFCLFALNLYTAIFNLLPLCGFDGGRILAAALTPLPDHAGRVICRVAGTTTAVLFYFLALYLTFLSGGGIYPFFLALFLLWREAKQYDGLLEDF